MTGRLPGQGECHLWSAPIGAPYGGRDLLSPGELRQADDLPDGTPRATFVTSRGLQRLLGSHYLGADPQALRIDRTCAHCGAGHGRPRIPGARLDYSVSHSRGHIVVGVVSEGLVGVDVDTVPSQATVDRLVRKALTPYEHSVWAQLPEDRRPAAFVRLWARKEAAAKLTGHGLAAAQNALDVDGSELVLSGQLPESWPHHEVHLRDVPWRDGHVLALASTSPVRHIVPRASEGLSW